MSSFPVKLEPDLPFGSFDEQMYLNLTQGPQDEKYHLKRLRNNLAVRKSREKRRRQVELVKDQIIRLEKEQQHLRKEIAHRKSQYEVLRDLYSDALSMINCESSEKFEKIEHDSHASLDQLNAKAGESL